MNPKFSICIPTYQNHTMLCQLLKSIDENTVMEYEIVLNDNSFEPLGYPKAINDCIKRARGEYIVLLNDDTIVESLWLEQMYSKLISDEKIGVVGADQVRNDNWGERMVAFWCVLIPKKIIDEIGLLDERFGIGTYEDNDYCKRLVNAGYKITATHAPITHKGTQTFNRIKPMSSVISENKKTYAKKWGLN